MSDLDFVRSLARHLCHDSHEADDVAQDAMVRALEKRPTEVSSWRGWLSVVTRNLALNRRRGDRRREARESAVARDLSVPSAGEVAEREQLRKRVVAAVMDLPEDFRAVVLLRHYRGLDTKQCAQQLGIPESTVRTRLKRGVDRLRAQLDEQHGGDRATWVSGLLPFAVPDAPKVAIAGAMFFGKAAMLFAALVVAALALVAWAPWAPEVAPPPVTDQVVTGGASTEVADPSPAGAMANDEAPRSNAERVAATPVPSPSDKWTLRGVVHERNAKKKTLAGAKLRIWVGPASYAYPMQGKPQELVCDDKGRFTYPLEALRNVEGDRKRFALFVEADADGYRPSWQQALWLGGAQKGVEEVSVPLEPGIFIKGRIVDAKRQPLENASLLLIAGAHRQRVLTNSFGEYVIDTLDCREHGYDRVLLGIHDQHGFSRARHVRVLDSGDTRIDDLVVENPLGVLHGYVRDPSGKARAGVTIEATRKRKQPDGDQADAVVIDGVRIASFTAVTASANANGYRAVTDAEGYFCFRNLQPGMHRAWMKGAFQQGLDVAVTETTAPVTMVAEGGFVAVRAVDDAGKDVPLGAYAVYRWTGPEAAKAAKRYGKDGPLPSLLQTAKRLTGLSHGSRLQAGPHTFVVVELDAPKIGASYGSCYLGAKEYQGEAVVRVAPTKRVGALKVQVRDAAGDKLTPVLVKCCRVAGVRAIPVRLPGATIKDPQSTTILGDWCPLPADGVLRGLPEGELTVEVLAGASIENRAVAAAAFLSSQHVVTIKHGGVQKLQVQAERGIELTFDLQLRPGGNEPRVRGASVFLNAVDGSYNVEMKLVPVKGEAFRFDGGRCRVRAVRPVPAGRYWVRGGLFPGLSTERVERTVHAGVGVIPLQINR